MRYQLIRLVIAAVLSVYCVVFAEEFKISVSPANLPDAIKQSIKTSFPNGQVVTVEKELDGERLVQYDAIIRSGGDVLEVEISTSGEIIEIKKQGEPDDAVAEKQERWTRSFDIEKRTFSTTGRNPFFILEPGYQLTLKKNTDKVVITVLKDTKVVDGIKTRVVEEREWEDGELVEVSRNFFAVCDQTNDVFYFGEEVDDYEDGEIVGHGGAWQAGQKGAAAGIIMPGTFLLGSRYYQEIAEGIAMDRAENTAMGLTISTPAGRLENCVKVVETSPMESGQSVKLYAPGIGIVDDDGFQLVDIKTGRTE